MMKRTLLTSIVAVAVAVGFAFGNAGMSRIPIAGQARIIDGDTIAIGSTHVRLQGVDSPELNTADGVRAKVLMEQIVGDSYIVCVPDGTRSYERVVAVCYRGLTDIGAEIIRLGGALDCPHFSHGRYADLETNRSLPHAIYCGVRP
jgi:micrococcal nuclease